MGGDPMMLALDVEPMGVGDWRWRWYDHDSGATLADGVERGERSAWAAALTHYVERSDECVRALAARAEAAEAALATARAEVDAAFQQGLNAGQVATCGALSAIAAEVASAGFDETATAIRIAAATLIKADLRLERGPVEGA
jgi:hypothetical protein